MFHTGTFCKHLANRYTVIPALLITIRFYFESEMKHMKLCITCNKYIYPFACTSVFDWSFLITFSENIWLVHTLIQHMHLYESGFYLQTESLQFLREILTAECLNLFLVKCYPWLSSVCTDFAANIFSTVFLVCASCFPYPSLDTAKMGSVL